MGQQDRIEGHRTVHSTMESKQRQGTHSVSQATVTDKKSDTFTKAKVWRGNNISLAYVRRGVNILLHVSVNCDPTKAWECENDTCAGCDGEDSEGLGRAQHSPWGHWKGRAQWRRSAPSSRQWSRNSAWLHWTLKAVNVPLQQKTEEPRPWVVLPRPPIWN